MKPWEWTSNEWSSPGGKQVLRHQRRALGHDNDDKKTTAKKKELCSPAAISRTTARPWPAAIATVMSMAAPIR
jgi:hypothetical protein